ncbi:hypothetical protein ACRE_064010 [Hapsidospora chrysogenum ATCC 11550]|uniref:Uncharacterized protein n=1 Tax=Hapsidospora chrysogenum (strain ATCC 11550 / CBS 779.69 / DSM 880 / IAM 14645 / JCM 23072 / IMI 49137) TaxID=857340 RepID=A0A086T0J8_HAPC1|nr:hypothetical protein ACRE_064010 [Hapsidospora chrysogenum ATCC 11550]
MNLVDFLHQYRMVFEQCPNVLRAIINIDAKHFDCQTLFKVLSTSKRATCGCSGQYLYPITCKRVCFSCLTCYPLYYPVSAELSTTYTGIRRRELERLPHVFSLPGR